MIIALPSRGNNVDGHFGHCEYFTIYTVNENNTIISEEKFQPPAECGCKSNLVPVLSEKGVTIMLAGNMGDGAVKKLNDFGIKVIRGCSGDVKAAAHAWLQGNLDDSGASCKEHGHECHEH